MAGKNVMIARWGTVRQISIEYTVEYSISAMDGEKINNVVYWAYSRRFKAIHLPNFNTAS